MNYTKLELKVIELFEFNYETLEENLEDNANYVDFDYCVKTLNLSANVLRGVFASLIKKELIFFDPSLDPGTFPLTGFGVKEYFNLYKL